MPFLNEIFEQPTEKMVITNLSTGEQLPAQFNPTELRKTVGVNWTRLSAPGAGREILHFNNTQNMKLPVQLLFDALSIGEGGRETILDVEAYLHSFAYPVGFGDVSTGGPPQLLFVWPNALSLTCIVESVETRHTAFARDGSPIRMTAQLALVEDPDDSLISSQVRDLRLRR